MGDMKHFNKGVIFGVIDNLKERTAKNDKKTPYMDIFIKCRSEQYGNFLTRFRCWDLETIGDIKETHIKNPGALWRFEGYIEQYEKDGKLYTGCSGFKEIQMLTEKTTQRSTFILSGKFNGMSPKRERATTMLAVIIEREEAKDEEFFAEIRLEDCERLGFNIKDIVRGDTVRLCGHQADLDAEFGSC